MEVSFFFSNFPMDHDERDMWKVFQRQGKLKDVFISRRLNIKKQRFGFVRFQEKLDVDALERRLSLIWIGTWKLRVGVIKWDGPCGPARDPLKRTRGGLVRIT